jgi:hypothetical protein
MHGPMNVKFVQEVYLFVPYGSLELELPRQKRYSTRRELTLPTNWKFEEEWRRVQKRLCICRKTDNVMDYRDYITAQQ